MLTIITLIWPLLGFEIFLISAIKNIVCKNKVNKNNLKKYAIPLALFIATFGFCLSFGKEANDLARYNDIIKGFKYQSLFEMLKKDSEMLYTRDFLFFLVYKTGDVRTLAFLVGFINYYIAFYVLFDVVENSNREFYFYEIIMMVMICIGVVSPYSIICNVRCVTAFILIVFATYRDLVQHKRNLLTFILYILPLGLHSSAIVILIIRFFSAIFKKFHKLAIILAFLVPSIIRISYSFVKDVTVNGFGEIFINAINKAYFYLNWTEGGWASVLDTMIYSQVSKIVKAVFLIILLLSYYLYIKNNKDNIKNNMIIFLIYILIFGLGNLSIKTGAFWRFVAIIVLFSPIIIVNLLENSRNFEIVFKILFVISAINFVTNFIYQIGFLSYWRETFKNLFLISDIKIILKIVKGFILLLSSTI